MPYPFRVLCGKGGYHIPRSTPSIRRRILISRMIRILGTVFVGLLGLAFGSFLNVCLSRWPQGESIVSPRSHCRHCNHTLAWWENIPLVSWLALRGRCSSCRAWISWRYPLVELAVGVLWALVAWIMLRVTWSGESVIYAFDNHYELAGAIGIIVLYWLLVALAVLDAENLWLPNWITLPGIIIGFIFSVWRNRLIYEMPGSDIGPSPFAPGWMSRLLGILAAAALILLIRWLYWLIRRREGIGLGDAKLMALLAAWLGLPGALLAFGLGVVLGAAVALVLLVIPATRTNTGAWALKKMPLGTFLCIGGIVSSLWGQHIIHAYLRWAGF